MILFFSNSDNNKPETRLGIMLLLIYPFVFVLSPFFGSLSVSSFFYKFSIQFMLCKPFFYRAVGYMNALCLFTSNIVGIIGICFVPGNVFYKISLFLVLFAIKFILAQFLSLQIAYFRNPKYYIFEVRFLLCVLFLSGKTEWFRKAVRD